MTDRTAGNPQARRANALLEVPANDEGPRLEALAARSTRAIAREVVLDDPCGEGGFDEGCRDLGGALCRFHAQHCHPPDYPCVGLLRHHLAVAFLEEVAARPLRRSRAE